jgi:hypothetical protein
MHLSAVVTMFCRLLFLLFTLAFSTFSAQAQLTTAEPDQIKNDANYYWGEFTAPTAREATDKALAFLIQQIAVKVTSEFTHITEERNKQLTETATGLVNSYAAATLRDVHTIRKPLKNGFYVFQYISRAEVAKIFEERERLVADIFRRAEGFQAELNYGYALKWYYNALLLMNSIPKAGVIVDGIPLTTEIPKRISALIEAVQFKVLDDVKLNDKERELTLAVSAGGKPLSRLTFSFWDGSDEVQVNALEGLATVRLFGGSTNMTELRCSIMYQFYSQRDEIKELADVWDFVNKPVFGEPKTVPLQKEEKPGKKKSKEPERSTTEIVTATPSGKLVITALPENYRKAAVIAENNINGLLVAMTTANSSIGDAQFSEKWGAILKYNSVQPSLKQPVWNAEPTWDAAEVREIAVVNRYKAIGLQSREYLVPDFDQQGNLIDVNYGVMEGLYENVRNQAAAAGDWKERLVLLKFLEKYRTAFMTRDLATLDMIFADEAVIIVGRKLRPGETTTQYNYVPEGNKQPGIAYLKQTKTEYLARQKKLFADRKDIYLGYNTFQIMRKNSQPGVYGISMRQNYQSDGYADEGYLFLLIDFNGKQPQIYVRAWQPNEWKEDALVGMGSFSVLR